MTATVNRKQFLSELQTVMAAVSRKSTIPILSGALLEFQKKTVRITGTDLETSIRSTVPATVRGKPVSLVIPIRDVVKFLSAAKGEAEDLSIAGGENQTILGDAKFGTLGSAESFPELPAVAEKVGSFAAGDLSRALRYILPCISAEESRFTLNGALLDPVAGGPAIGQVAVVSTDGARLCHIAIPGTLASKMLVSRKVLHEVGKLVSGAFTLYADENHQVFSIGHREYYTRRLNGNFPDYERVIPKEFKHVSMVDAGMLRQAIAKVAPFTDERSHAMWFVFNGSVHVHAETSDRGSCSADLPVLESQGPNVEIGFNCTYVTDFIGKIPKGQPVCVGLNSGEQASIWTADGAQVVIMPIRI